MVYSRDDVEGLDASILTNKKVLKYSGHEDTFTDPLVDCKDCNNRMRADHLKDSKCLLNFSKRRELVRQEAYKFLIFLVS